MPKTQDYYQHFYQPMRTESNRVKGIQVLKQMHRTYGIFVGHAQLDTLSVTATGSKGPLSTIL